MSALSDGAPRAASFAIIDFEASSLDEDSYPIEVGLAIVRDGAIESWSSLIRPTREWVKRGAWSRRSELVHQISRVQLVDAPSPAEVGAELNRRAGGFGAVYCDGGSYDAHWLAELFADADIQPTFQLADISLLVRPHQKTGYSAALATTKPPHRAASDAIRIAEALLRSKG